MTYFKNLTSVSYSNCIQGRMISARLDRDTEEHLSENILGFVHDKVRSNSALHNLVIAGAAAAAPESFNL